MLSACCAWFVLTMGAAGVAPQGPRPDGGGEPDPVWVRVEGPIELTPVAADAAAVASALDSLRLDLERRTIDATSRSRPRWLPDAVAQAIGSSWLARQDASRLLQVEDSSRHVRDHGTFESFQTTLAVRHDQRKLDRMFTGLASELRRRGKALGLVTGGSAALWTILLLAYGWLDRLTRGYMPWRLRLACVGMGLALPGIAFLLV